jgi:hypothetical protein
MKTAVLFSLLLASVALGQQTQGTLTNQRIGDMVLAGVSETEIVRVISSVRAFSFDLRPNSTDALLAVGVSEDIIKAMAAKEIGGQAPTASAAPSTTVARANYAAEVPRTLPAAIPTAPATRVAAPMSQSKTRIASSYGAMHDGAGHKLTYDGGSIPNLKTGNSVKLYLDQNQIHVFKDGVEVTTLPASAVTEITYGQDVHRRVGAAIGLATVSLGVGALMALTKSKKHFIGITWDDAGNKGGAAFQADKSDYRGVLAGLQGITGKGAVSSDSMTVKN